MGYNLQNKILYGFGDSLVYGHEMGIGMLDYVAEKNGMLYTKYAVNGASVIPNLAQMMEMDIQAADIGRQVQQASKRRPDYICFDGLTNDAYSYVTEMCLGKLSRHYDGNYDVTTFIGAFEEICFLLREKYLSSKIVYICPHRMISRDMKVQEILQYWARKICEKWSIPYVDVYNRGGINTCISQMQYDYTYDDADRPFGGTGTHLTDQGYRLWYAPMIENALRNV